MRRFRHVKRILLVDEAVLTSRSICGPLDVNNLVFTHGLRGWRPRCFYRLEEISQHAGVWILAARFWTDWYTFWIGYHKFRGGFSVEFVGFQMKYDTKEVGVTIRRGDWLRDWILAAADKQYVVVTRDFAEFLGRLGFVSQLLVWMKPHLSPLYAWSAATGSSTVAKLPDTVILTLKYILAELQMESY